MEPLRKLHSMQKHDQYNERSRSVQLDIARKREMDRIMLNCLGMSSRFLGKGRGTEDPSLYMNQLVVPNDPVQSSLAFPNSATRGVPSLYGNLPNQYRPTVINSLNRFNGHAIHSQQFNQGLNGAPSLPMQLPFSGNVHFPNSSTGYMPNHHHQVDTREAREVLSDCLLIKYCQSHNRQCEQSECLKGKFFICHIRKCRDNICGCNLIKKFFFHFKTCIGRCVLCKPVLLDYYNKLSNSTKRKMPDPEINMLEVLNVHSKRSKIGDGIELGKPTSRPWTNDTKSIVETESFVDKNCVQNKKRLELCESTSMSPAAQKQVKETIRENLCNNLIDDAVQSGESTSRHVRNENKESGMILQEEETIRESLIEINCKEPSLLERYHIQNEQEEELCDNINTSPSAQEQAKEIIIEKSCNDQETRITDVQYSQSKPDKIDDAIQFGEPTSRHASSENEEYSGMNLQEEETRRESVIERNCMEPSLPETNCMKVEQKEELCENINTSPSAQEQSKEIIIEKSCDVQSEEMANKIFSEAVDSDVAMQSVADLNETKQPRRNCTSLINSFTSDQIQEHILDLRQSNEKSKTTNEHKAMDSSVDENCCSLCELSEITFEKPPSICSRCCHCIREGAFYTKLTVESTNEGGAALICKKCYAERYKSTSNSVVFEKMINSETNEQWVQCDKCKKWQHQICALFNDKKNVGDQAEYTCPNCYLTEIESKNHQTLAKCNSFEAKQLPRTKLSDHLEQWLSRRLEEERQKRANNLGKNINEVARAEDLVVRVVSSVNKKVRVMESLRKVFLKDDYPEELPYKSKVILLFQKIGGADVCLFAAYVQEYGPDCPDLNRGRVYLSYIDSVNYFRPRINAATGDSLRTYVYHEILIGYLDYCSKRGFTHCHLWVYPPSKNDNFILYSHPDEQKMPSVSRLRQWYHALIRKATEENIVLGCSNLYDQYFKPNSKRKTEELPCFDGDFWPRLAENILNDETGSAIKQIMGKLASSSKIKKFEDVMRKNKKDLIVIKLRSNNEASVHRKKHETTKSRLILNMDMEEEVNISSRILDWRADFLTLCEKNNYRFNTLRRAKHSTMMIIHHLHEDALQGT